MANGRSGSMIFGSVLIVLGLLGVYVPHIAFLAEIIPSLNVVSHSFFEIGSATVIVIGLLLGGGFQR